MQSNASIVVQNQMKRELQQTADGSHTLFIPEMDEHYHSVNGAVQESRHVFIEAGLHHQAKKDITVFEIGFGTGLNAFLTLLEARDNERKVVFHTFEKYPLTPQEVEQINYSDLFTPEDAPLFQQLHDAPWEEDVVITPYFTLHKHRADFEEVNFHKYFDMVFFDAFAPDVQPRLWTESMLSKFYKALKPEGILTTYCVKGTVKQALRNIGFNLKRLPGPPGKREMLRAVK